MCSTFIGCASTPATVSPKEAHNSCYSYIYGENGFPLNYEKAYKWCSIAADYKIPSAQTLLAELYLDGNGVTKNLVVAANLYKKAASQGHPHAQLMYFIVQYKYRVKESSLTEKEEGLEFLNLSVKQGYKKAVDVYSSLFTTKI
jgi:TPR repeat protein